MGREGKGGEGGIDLCKSVHLYVYHLPMFICV